MTWLERTVYGDTLQRWLLALLVAVAMLAIFLLIRRLVVRRVSIFTARTRISFDDFLADLVGRTHFLFLLIVALYLGSLWLAVYNRVGDDIARIVVIALFIQIGIWGVGAINFWISRYKQARLDTDASSVTVVSSLSLVVKMVLWTIVLLLILDNLGYRVDSLIAGLGITGVAVALAVQNILGDLFASFSIVLDKPFVIGDTIVVEDFVGTVENIGLKTTRLRSLSGEQIVFSNTDLLQSRIRNYKLMRERRAIMNLGVTYETPPEKLAELPAIIREIIQEQEQVRFERAHFKEFGPFSLNFEVVFFVLSPDYTLYMNIQQAVNLALLRRFQAEGIELAYPTQTLFLKEPEQASKAAVAAGKGQGTGNGRK